VAAALSGDGAAGWRPATKPGTWLNPVWRESYRIAVSLLKKMNPRYDDTNTSLNRDLELSLLGFDTYRDTMQNVLVAVVFLHLDMSIRIAVLYRDTNSI
jgi:hypothetical protein